MTAAELVGCSPAELTAAAWGSWSVSVVMVLGYVVLVLARPRYPWAAFVYASAGMLVCAAVSAGLGGVLVSAGFAVLAVHAAVAVLLTRDAAKRGAR